MLEKLLQTGQVRQLSNVEKKLVIGGVIPSGTCAVEGGNGYVGVSGVSKEYAMEASSATGGHWCCDSCQDATWLTQDHKDYLQTMS